MDFLFGARVYPMFCLDLVFTGFPRVYRRPFEAPCLPDAHVFTGYPRVYRIPPLFLTTCLPDDHVFTEYLLGFDESPGPMSWRPLWAVPPHQSRRGACTVGAPALLSWADAADADDV